MLIPHHAEMRGLLGKRGLVISHSAVPFTLGFVASRSQGIWQGGGSGAKGTQGSWQGGGLGEDTLGAISGTARVAGVAT